MHGAGEECIFVSMVVNLITKPDHQIQQVNLVIFLGVVSS